MQDEENKTQENSVDTVATTETEVGTETEQTTETEIEQNENVEVENEKPIKEDEGEEKEKTFTQEQVNNLIRDRIERERQTIFNKYGVKDKNGLDEIFERSNAYNELHDKYKETKTQLNLANRENVFLKNDIEPSRYGDIDAYFTGKNLELSDEVLKQELSTHPEWKKVEPKQDKPKTTINFVSPERSHSNSVDEKEVAAKMFGLKKIL